jgi:hypothetical protein
MVPISILFMSRPMGFLLDLLRSKKKITTENRTMARERIIGSKAEVWHGSKLKTRSGLRKKDLMLTKRGRIVSRKKHAAGKQAIKRLRSLGYIAKKGTFKLMRKSMVDGRRKSKKGTKKRGGAADLLEAFNNEVKPVAVPK